MSRNYGIQYLFNSSPIDICSWSQGSKINPTEITCGTNHLLQLYSNGTSDIIIFCFVDKNTNRRNKSSTFTPTSMQNGYTYADFSHTLLPVTASKGN